MITSDNQYLVAIEKLADLRKYLVSVRDFPVKNKVIQKAIEQGAESLIVEIDKECITYVKG